MLIILKISLNSHSPLDQLPLRWISVSFLTLTSGNQRKDKKDKYNDKYIGEDKDKNVGD